MTNLAIYGRTWRRRHQKTELANIHIARGEALWKQANISGATQAFTEALEILRSPHLPENRPDVVNLRRSAQAALDDLQHQTRAATP